MTLRLVLTGLVVVVAAFAGGVVLGGDGDPHSADAGRAGAPLKTVRAAPASLHGARLGRAERLPALKRQRRRAAAGSAAGDAATGTAVGRSGSASAATPPSAGSGSAGGAAGSTGSGTAGSGSSGAGTGSQGATSNPPSGGGRQDEVVVTED
jgi:hypothetical protein